jgi:hypothetical protein
MVLEFDAVLKTAKFVRFNVEFYKSKSILYTRDTIHKKEQVIELFAKLKGDKKP